MATATDLFQILSSFYREHVQIPDQEFIVSLWDGYLKHINETYRVLYQYDQAKSIGAVGPTITREWFHLDLSYLSATADPFTYKIDEEIISIPQLQDGITTPELGSSRVLTTLLDSTDYTVNSEAHTIEFVSVAGKAWISRDVSLLDSVGILTKAGQFVAAGGLVDLVEGTDYSWLNAEHTQIRLMSKAIFDLFALLGDGIAQRALEDKILFAPTLQTDEKLVYKNYGFLLGILPQDIAVDVATYARMVKGLWYIAWNGPTPFNLSIGISVVFGYPVAPLAGTIQNVSGSGPTVVTLAPAIGGELVTVTIPTGFTATVDIGDIVVENQPLSDSLEILDDTTSPGWWSVLGLPRYAVNHQLPLGLSGSDQLALKESLKNSVFGIRLKDISSIDDMDLRDQVMRVASKFLTRLKPYYSQFAFVGDILFTEGGPDSATAIDEAFSTQITQRMHQTISANSPNELFLPGHVTTPFLDADDYAVNAVYVPPYQEPSYYLGSDSPFVTEDLHFRVKYPGSGGVFIDDDDRSWGTYNLTKLADIRAPDLSLHPDPGRYFYEISVRVRPNEPCTMLYTLDGRTPGFGDPLVGKAVSGRIQIPEGSWTLKVAAKDLAGNISVVLSADYEVVLGMPPLVVSPASVIPSRSSIAATLSHVDPTIDVFYTTDGTAPTDFAFKDILRLGGHRVVWDSSTSIRLEDPNRPVFFPRGTATVNVGGARNYEIHPRRNTRYFIYALRTGDNRWRLSISAENIRFEANSATRLLLGYVISDRSGLFSEGSIINAVDTGDVQKLDKDLVISGAILNITEPVPLLNDKTKRILRFFGKTPGGLFDPPQTHIYRFDTVAPRTKLVSSFGNQPYTKTLKIDFQAELGSTVYWSSTTKAPQRILFGAADKLVDGPNSLALSVSAPNTVIPNHSTLTLSFKRLNANGELTTLTTTADLRSGGAVTIPGDSLAFYDIVVVPDLANAGKWRLDVGPANTPVPESPGVYKVARVFNDAAGVLNPGSGSGDIRNATATANLSNLAKKTHKYLGEPIVFDVTGIFYKVTIAFFAEDAAGNIEETRAQVFSG